MDDEQLQMADGNAGSGGVGGPAVSADSRGNGRWRGGRGGGRSGSRAHRGAHRQRGPRPNFFVGFRITTGSIIAQIEQLQQSIALALPELEMCLIDPRTLHVTLCVLRLSDDEGAGLS